jgi:hypothetical protein
MAAGPTYEPIYTTTTSNTTTNSISLSSFSGYTDLILVMTGHMSVNGYFYIRFNNDTSTSSYSELRFLAYSGGVLSDYSNTQGFLDASIGIIAAKPGSAKLFMPSYTNTSIGKTNFMQQVSDASINMQTNYWNSTAAISSIQLTAPTSDYFGNGFQVTLYGLLAA